MDSLLTVEHPKRPPPQTLGQPLSPLPANYNKRRGCPIEDASPLTDTKVPHIEWDERRLKEPDTCAP